MFYTYSQNNSGGNFITDDNVCRYVIIEADTPEDADDIAEQIGIYFDGYGDCQCCGDRWYRTSKYDANETPMVCGEPVSWNNQYVRTFAYPGEVYCRIYYAGLTIIKEFKAPDNVSLAIEDNSDIVG